MSRQSGRSSCQSGLGLKTVKAPASRPLRSDTRVAEADRLPCIRRTSPRAMASPAASRATGLKAWAQAVAETIAFSPSVPDQDDRGVRRQRKAREMRLEARFPADLGRQRRRLVAADGGVEQNGGAGAGRRNGLVQPLAAEPDDAVPGHQRFTGHGKAVDRERRVAAEIADHVNAHAPDPSVERRARAAARPAVCVSRRCRRRVISQPALKTRTGFCFSMRSIAAWSMPCRFRRGTKCLRM